MNDYEYTKNHKNEYILNLSGKEINMGKHMALAYSYKKTDGKFYAVLHKHGNSDIVSNWYNKAVIAYNNAGLYDESASLYLLKGDFDLEELNKCLCITDYIGKFHEIVFNIKKKVSV